MDGASFRRVGRGWRAQQCAEFQRSWFRLPRHALPRCPSTTLSGGFPAPMHQSPNTPPPSGRTERLGTAALQTEPSSADGVTPLHARSCAAWSALYGSTVTPAAPPLPPVARREPASTHTVQGGPASPAKPPRDAIAGSSPTRPRVRFQVGALARTSSREATSTEAEASSILPPPASGSAGSDVCPDVSTPPTAHADAAPATSCAPPEVCKVPPPPAPAPASAPAPPPRAQHPPTSKVVAAAAASTSTRKPAVPVFRRLTGVHRAPAAVPHTGGMRGDEDWKAIIAGLAVEEATIAAAAPPKQQLPTRSLGLLTSPPAGRRNLTSPTAGRPTPSRRAASAAPALLTPSPTTIRTHARAASASRMTQRSPRATQPASPATRGRPDAAASPFVLARSSRKPPIPRTPVAPTIKRLVGDARRLSASLPNADASVVNASDAHAAGGGLVEEGAGVAVLVADLLARVECQVAERVGEVALARYLAPATGAHGGLAATPPAPPAHHHADAPATLSMLAQAALHELMSEPGGASPGSEGPVAPATPSLPALPISPDSTLRPARAVPTPRAAREHGTGAEQTGHVSGAITHVDGEWMA
jgi:hypothetical protein